ncbi:hypothetical protein Tco_0653729 [Tanacetum coccineum]|uniref:Uncharacterized protein n=1 Tax=Tanacetum coccineum TaxID=301880 RepID=A0ABQ4X206_9ASTR
MIHSTGVNGATAASGSNPRSNTKKDRTFPAKSDTKKVEDHPRNNKSSVKRKNHVDSSISYKRTIINSNSNSVCQTCNKCLMSFNHDKCVVKSVKFVKKPPVKKVWRVKQVQQVWQATSKLFTNVGYQTPTEIGDPTFHTLRIRLFSNAEKQAGNVQTNLTLSSAKLETQSMVDAPIHQEDPATQRTLLIDTVILMVTDKTSSTPTPPTTQAQV